jgi:hypothetical protein
VNTTQEDFTELASLLANLNQAQSKVRLALGELSVWASFFLTRRFTSEWESAIREACEYNNGIYADNLPENVSISTNTAAALALNLTRYHIAYSKLERSESFDTLGKFAKFAKSIYDVWHSPGNIPGVPVSIYEMFKDTGYPEKFNTLVEAMHPTLLSYRLTEATENQFVLRRCRWSRIAVSEGAGELQDYVPYVSVVYAGIDPNINKSLSKIAHVGTGKLKIGVSELGILGRTAFRL